MKSTRWADFSADMLPSGLIQIRCSHYSTRASILRQDLALDNLFFLHLSQKRLQSW